MMPIRKDTYRIRRTILWLRRWRRTRGFGVQSPTDYYFIRHVINQHCPYYAYDKLNRELPHIDRKTRKVCKLWFRIANWMQPKTILLHDIVESAFGQYMHNGCRTANIHYTQSETDTQQAIQIFQKLSHATPMLMATTMNKQNLTLMENVLQHAGNDTILIINGIHQSRQQYNLWRKIYRNNKATLTFDVYYCGIIRFNEGRTKQHYIINY